MDFLVSEQSDVNVARTIGKPDTNSSPDAASKLMGLIDSGIMKAVINFAELDFTREVFEISGLDTTLTVADDEAAARDAL